MNNGLLSTKSSFSELDPERTLWEMGREFRCKGVMWVLITLMPGMFEKQTQATMEAFKAFAEGASATH